MRFRLGGRFGLRGLGWIAVLFVSAAPAAVRVPGWCCLGFPRHLLSGRAAAACGRFTVVACGGASVRLSASLNVRAAPPVGLRLLGHRRLGRPAG